MYHILLKMMRKLKWRNKNSIITCHPIFGMIYHHKIICAACSYYPYFLIQTLCVSHRNSIHASNGCNHIVLSASFSVCVDEEYEKTFYAKRMKCILIFVAPKKRWYEVIAYGFNEIVWCVAACHVCRWIQFFPLWRGFSQIHRGNVCVCVV